MRNEVERVKGNIDSIKLANQLAKLDQMNIAIQ